MTSALRQKPGNSPFSKKRVSLNSALPPIGKSAVKERLSINSRNGRIAEMSFSNAGMKKGEL